MCYDIYYSARYTNGVTRTEKQTASLELFTREQTGAQM